MPRRSWRWLGVIAVTALVVLGAWTWFLWVPSYRPALLPGEEHGIDVSHHQGKIDWPLVAADGIGFAYIKATEGGDFLDRRFEENWDGAGDAGLRRGAYHFFTLCTPGAEQARHFLSVLPEHPAALPPAVDLELSGNCADRPARADLLRELETFLRRIEETRATDVTLYVGDDFEERYRVRAELDRPLWHRRALFRPDVSGWVIWQVWGYARVAGIEGRVDLNVMRAA
jgi:lysozyme